MVKKPELIVFCQYKIGGVQSFYYNILSHDPYNAFDTKWIFVESSGYEDPRPMQLFGIKEEIVFNIAENESVYNVSARLKQLISKAPGVVVTNFETELAALHLYRMKKKCIFFICHDELYLNTAKKYSFLIDIFVAHNEYFYFRLQKELPERADDIFYKPYGVAIPPVQRSPNPASPLKIVIAARLQVQKGVHDIPKIDDLLKEKGIPVEWTIVGDGQEKEELQRQMLPRGNCRFYTVATNEEVRDILLQHDIFILPSRLEGLPVSLLEAMSVGCVPVIAAFNEGIKKVVPDEVGYVLPVGDNPAFADAIAFLHWNRHVLETKSATARKKIEADFNITKRAKEYFDLFWECRNYKKPYEFRLANYGGMLYHPSLPVFIKWPLVKMKKVIGRLRMRLKEI